MFYFEFFKISGFYLHALKLAIREVKIPRFRCTCTGSMILVSNIFVDVCSLTRN
jgi:hypothetical protein